MITGEASVVDRHIPITGAGLDVRCLRAENIVKNFPARGSLFKKKEQDIAIKDVSLALRSREIVGIVGDSGSGKTTFAKIFAGLLPPTDGDVFLDDLPLYGASRQGYREARKAIRFMFQNVEAPLNPRMSIDATLEEPLIVHTSMSRAERKTRMQHVADEVELPMSLLQKYPRGLSGGEKRRVGIARALMHRPSFIIADEPTAGLDEDLRFGLLKLFCRLRDEENIGILFISHDLYAVATICNEVIVMANGKSI